MSAFFAVVKKELASVLRDRTIIIAILIQLFIASFSSALLLGMLSLYDADTILQLSGARIKVGMVGGENPLAGFLRERGMTVTPFETLEEAQTEFFKNKVNAIFVAQPNSAEIELYLPKNEAVRSLLRMVLQEPMKRYENSLRSERGIDVRYADLQGKPATSFEFMYSVLLPMLMFFPAFVAGSMSVDALTEETENNTLQTLLSSPLSPSAMVSAKMSAAVFLAFAQCAAWLGLLSWNGVEIQNPAWILALALLMAGSASALAMLGAVLLKDRERSQFIYSLALLAAAALGGLLNVSPVVTLSRLALGDAFTSGWDVSVYFLLFAALYALLWKFAPRLSK
ncbi:MAG: hypothetical protein Fur002_07430 [Anaerolineales bacterium]